MESFLLPNLACVDRQPRSGPREARSVFPFRYFRVAFTGRLAHVQGHAAFDVARAPGELRDDPRRRPR